MFPRIRRVWAAHLLTPEGWRSPAALELDAAGLITTIHASEPEAWRGQDVLRLAGFVVPGLPNLHSHAFQRALSGRTELWTAGGDDFWSWRDLMYRVAGQITPDEQQDLATALYVECLEAGMTSVAEFHYVHHDPSGRRYAEPATMSLSLVAAAELAGLGLTLLPVLYQHGGLGQPATAGQRRFLHPHVDEYLRLVERLLAIPGLTVGIAPHSLRAVDAASLRQAVEAFARLSPQGPIHLHIAEQTAEVEQCLQHLGARPVSWLLDHHTVDARWCLVHATHVDSGEVARLAHSGAVAGLCPTTEANLGDGLFPAADYLAAGGALGVGSDSHATVSPFEELRLLEYGQRLVRRRRNVLGHAHTPRMGQRLWSSAVEGGARALGRAHAGLTVGAPADLVMLEPTHPRLCGHGPETVLDAAIFGSAERPVREVVARGQHVVHGGRHLAHAAVWSRFERTLAGLLARAG